MSKSSRSDNIRHGFSPLVPAAYLRGGRANKETQNLPGVPVGPNIDNPVSAQKRLRASARYLYENYPQATGFVDKRVRQIFGGGFRIQAKMRKQSSAEALIDENEALEQAVAKAWRSASPTNPNGGFLANGQSFRAAMKLGLRAQYTDGECFLVSSVSRRNGRTISREWQLLSSDYLADNDGYSDANYQGKARENAIIQGIEFSPSGRPVAYYFRQDIESYGNAWGISSKPLQRIPAKRVIHWFTPTRPGQVRGIPILSYVLLHFSDLEEFCKAKIQAEWVAACYAGFYSYSQPNGLLSGSMIDSETDSEGNTTYSQDIVSGTITQLPANCSMTFADPNRPGGNMAEFTKVYLAAIGIALGDSYPEFTGDYSATNYSSLRAARTETEQVLSDISTDIDESPLYPIWEDAVSFIYDVNMVLPKPADVIDVTAHTVTHPRIGWVDPAKEAKANEINLANQTHSISGIIRSRGEDPQEVFDEQKADAEALAKRGIVYGVKSKTLDGAQSNDGEEFSSSAFDEIMARIDELEERIGA